MEALSISDWESSESDSASDSEDSRLGLLGGVIGCSAAWVISIKAIVNEKDGRRFDVRGSNLIHKVKRFGKMIEELDAENIEGDDDENFRGIASLYIRLR